MEINMKFQQGVRRIQTQLDALERMIRIIRSDLETQASALPGLQISTTSQIKSGLAAVFEKGETLAPIQAQPYDHVMPDVWVGLDQENGSAGVTIAARSIASPGIGAAHDRVTRITLNPVFPLQEKPRWVTLETRLDTAETAAAKAIRIDIISSLEIARINREEIPKTIGVTLRMTQENGLTKDVFHHWLPISTVPFEHALQIGESALRSAEIGTARNVFCILELPLSGDYAFNLDWFAVNSVAA